MEFGHGWPKRSQKGVSSLVNVYYCYVLCGLTAGLGGLLTCMLRRTPLGGDSTWVIWLYRAGFSALVPMGLFAVLTPALRPAAIPIIFSLAASGAVCLTWALRELTGAPLPRALGVGLVILGGGAVGLVGAISLQAYAIYANLVFALIGVVALVDQLLMLRQKKRITAGEIGLITMLIVYAAIFCGAFFYAAVTPPSQYPEHGLFLPPSVVPVAATMLSILPLSVAALAFAVINERLVGRLESLALTDELTGAWSRRGLSELGPFLIAEHRRNAKEIAVMMVDIDYFKRINDTHGHDAGDKALRHVCTVLRSQLRSDALLARYGGEEFTVLLPLDHREELHLVSERLRQSVAQTPCMLADGPLSMTVSVGVAQLGPNDPLRATMALADQRLYQAKQSGRDRVVAA